MQRQRVDRKGITGTVSFSSGRHQDSAVAGRDDASVETGKGRHLATPAISIVFFAVAAFLGALGQYLYQSGANAATGTLSGYLANPRLIAGVACYVAVMALFVAGFRRGGSMTVLYPVYASTFIWAAFIGWFACGTPIRAVNVAGMALIVGGMILMGK